MTSMVYFEESQQHLLRDIHESLVELRQLIDAQAKSIRPARFEQQWLTEEPPDSLDAHYPQLSTWHTRPPDVCRKLHALTPDSRSSPVWPPDQQLIAEPTRRWSLPPSVTQAPLGIKPHSLPRIRLEPPRFDGEMVSDWIRKIQTYYNHHYTPLDDRLYFTKYLFDHPASDWMEYWMDTNAGKSWDDFLLAVRQRFDPDFYDPYAATASPFRGTRWTGQDQRQPIRRTAPPIANRELDRPPPQRHEEVTQEVVSSEFCVNLFGVQPLIANESGHTQLMGDGCMNIDKRHNAGDRDGIFVDIKPTNDSPSDKLGSEAFNITYGVITTDNIKDDEYDKEHSTLAQALHEDNFCTNPLSQLRISPPEARNTNLSHNIVTDVAVDSGVAHEKIVSALASVVDIVPSDTRVPSYGVVCSIKLAQPIEDPRYGARPTLSYANAMKSWSNQPYLFSFGGRNLFMLEQTLIYDARLIPPCDDALLLGRNPIMGCKGPPAPIANYPSSFGMLRNCVADPDNDSLEVPSAVRRQCVPSYYIISLGETREYKSHEYEHGKSYVRCVLGSNKGRTSSGVLGNYSMDLKFMTARIGIFFEIQLFKSLLNDETKSWYVTCLAPSNECDNYEAWEQFWSCNTQALEMCSCLRKSADGFKEKGDDTCVHGNGARTIRATVDNDLNCDNAGGPLPITEMSEFCHEQAHHASISNGVWPSAVTYGLLISVFWDIGGTQTSRLFKVFPPPPLSFLQLPYSVVYFPVLSRREILPFRDRVVAAMIELHLVDSDIHLTTLIKDKQMFYRAVLVRDFHHVNVRKYSNVIQVEYGVIESRYIFSKACRACYPCLNKDWKRVQTVFLSAAGKFQVGDKVILFLRPYDQHSLGHPVAAMLDRCFYGPFAVVGYIGAVADWSQLLRKHFPNLRLVDKAIFMGGGVDRDSTSRMSQPPSPSPTSSSAMPDDAEEDVPRKEVKKKSGRKERPKREASKPADTETMYHTNKGREYLV